MQLFAIQNQIATQTFQCEPWSYSPNVPEHATKDKDAFKAWSKSGDTEHLFFSASEGMVPGIRPSKDNDVFYMHGLIADYDVSGNNRITDEMIDGIKASIDRQFWPNWVSSTFSGGARLVWLFEKRLAVEQPKLRKLFLDQAGRVHLRLKSLLAGLDANAWMDVCKYYEVGSNWRQFKEDPIPMATLETWMWEASRRLKPEDMEGEGPEIPLEEVFKEVERKYPGRWAGPFEEGRRGVVFFDDSSVNATAAIVTAKGMVCFGQERTFYTWSDIFGKAFVEKFVQDKVGRAIKDVWVDQKGVYWYPNGRDQLWPHNKETLSLRLKSLGLDPNKGKRETLSEVDSAVHYVNEHKTVSRVTPKLFDDRVTIPLPCGGLQLNTATAKAMAPADEPAVWGPDGKFPFLSEFLDTCWADLDVPQKDHFLGWWKWFYEGAFHGLARRGHAIFLIGPVDTGKSFLGNVPISMSVGGGYPAAEYLKGENPHPKEEFERAVWTVDDTSASHSDDTARKFGEQIKAHVVNTHFQYNPKFVQASRVEWNGRIVVSMNDDIQSMRIMPPLDNSIDDKVMVFKMKKPTVTFSKDYAANEARMRQELPHFLRWLLDWEMPEHISVAEGRSGARLGVKRYIHEDIRRLSLVSSGHTVVLEMIHKFMRGSAKDNGVAISTALRLEETDDVITMEGSALEITSALHNFEAISQEAKRYDARRMGRALGLLVDRGCGVDKSKAHTSSSETAIWKITLNK